MEADETSLRYRGWRVVVLCFTMAMFAWGFAFYGHSIYLAELQRLHGWSSFTISAASTVSYLFGALLVIFVGEAIVCLTPRWFLMGGTACFGLSVALVGAVAVPWQLYAAYLLMSFGWAATSLVAITTLTAMWFQKRRGLAISLALTGASFGGILGAPLLVAAIDLAGFTMALMIGAVVMVAVLVPMILAWGGLPPAATAGPSGNSIAHSIDASVDEEWTRGRALRSVGFWTLTAPFALALLAQVGFIVHLVAMLEPGIGRISAGFTVSIITISAVVGRIGLGLVIDRLSPRLVSALSLLSQVAALLIIAAVDDPLIILLACGLFGLSVGNLITLPAIIIQGEFSARAFPLVIGLSSAICQVAFAFGPGLLGLLRDMSGSYTVPLLLCVVLDAIAAAVVLIRPSRAAPNRSKAAERT